ncbi:arginine methyltransferase 8 [Musca autumnalis]|uniref:arginine methyltransferase 8 n=1 Tax=Musca autumnalis TaxID=221902 RepID=UPI003CF135D6
MEGLQNTYFSEYEDLEVHEIMLRDRPRQEAYKNAIMQNAALFKDKVVMDVGAGTGILSAFCAKAGAKLVYAVEASNLAKIALTVMEENSLTSIVKVIHDKVEDFVLPSTAEKVDIIVSEWMGFYLLHEGMLDSVIFARDNFLKPDGHMFPSEATIYVAPCSVPSRFDDWNNIDGICLSSFGNMLRRQKSSKPEIVSISPENLLHSGVAMFWMNINEIRVEELESIVFQEVVPTQYPGKHQGFCIWFDCRFPGENYENSVVLSTGPNATTTHWKQCIVVLPDNACEELEENAPVAFKISMIRRNDDKRKYNLEVELLDPNVIDHPVPCECHYTKCILIKTHLQNMDTS